MSDAHDPDRRTLPILGALIKPKKAKAPKAPKQPKKPKG